MDLDDAPLEDANQIPKRTTPTWDMELLLSGATVFALFQGAQAMMAGGAYLLPRLQGGGYIHCATDWEPYAQQMLEVLSAEPLLENTTEAYAPRPHYRPLTKFENRGLRLGHGVWDLVFRRR